jgi:hypothetical protein
MAGKQLKRLSSLIPPLIYHVTLNLRVVPWRLMYDPLSDLITPCLPIFGGCPFS